MNYVILSEGEYSDYSPGYYAGPRKITKTELESKGKEIGDKLFDWYGSLETRMETNFFGREVKRKYDGEEWVPSSSLSEKWLSQMEDWLNSQGFKPLPEDIPEINVQYDEIPHSKGGLHA